MNFDSLTAKLKMNRNPAKKTRQTTGNLKIDNSLLRQITFDENSNIPDDLRYQISLITFIEPIENFADYLDRIYKNHRV